MTLVNNDKFADVLCDFKVYQFYPWVKPAVWNKGVEQNMIPRVNFETETFKLSTQIKNKTFKKNIMKFTFMALMVKKNL